jgi:hypothetical protein
LMSCEQTGLSSADAIVRRPCQGCS